MTIFEVPGPLAGRPAKYFLCASLLLVCTAASADNAPLQTQIVDLANKVDGVHPGYRAFRLLGGRNGLGQRARARWAQRHRAGHCLSHKCGIGETPSEDAATQELGVEIDCYAAVHHRALKESVDTAMAGRAAQRP